MHGAVTRGFALGYLMWPFQGLVSTSCHRQFDCDHAIKHGCAVHRLW